MFTDNDDTQVVGFFGMFPGDLKEAYRLSVDRLGPAVRFGIVDDPDLVKLNRRFEDRVVLFRWDFTKIVPMAMAITKLICSGQIFSRLLTRTRCWCMRGLDTGPMSPLGS